MMNVLLRVFGATCVDNSFLGFPNWYRGLARDSDCGVQLSGLTDIWLVVANLVEMALRLAGILAVVFILVGGFMFLTSRGEPEQTKHARDILTNAIIGLIISILATTIVSFVASRF